jgi:hypothetical protein
MDNKPKIKYIMNGKGDSPRNCFSKEYKKNYDAIDWKNKKNKKKKKLCPKH